MALLLYRFKFRDPVTRRWVKARHVEELEVIRQRYAEFELLGDPEVREVSQGPGLPDKRAEVQPCGTGGAVCMAARLAGSRRTGDIRGWR